MELIQCDAGNADWARQLAEELAGDLGDGVVGIYRLAEDDLAMVINIVETKNPEVNAARIELFAAQTVADVFGEMNDASFGFGAGESFAVHDILAADGLNIAGVVVDLDAAEAEVPFVAVDTLADELYERHFIGVEKLKRRKNADRVEASLHTDVDSRQIGEF